MSLAGRMLARSTRAAMRHPLPKRSRHPSRGGASSTPLRVASCRYLASGHCSAYGITVNELGKRGKTLSARSRIPGTLRINTFRRWLVGGRAARGIHRSADAFTRAIQMGKVETCFVLIVALSCQTVPLFADIAESRCPRGRNQHRGPLPFQGLSLCRLPHPLQRRILCPGSP